MRSFIISVLVLLNLSGFLYSNQLADSVSLIETDTLVSNDNVNYSDNSKSVSPSLISELKTLDGILLSVQIFTLFALIVYVIKTWEIASATKHSSLVSKKILKEMQDTRDTETAPFVTAYFDIESGKPWIYLILKNSGKSFAKDVRIEFNPKLTNSRGEQIGELNIFKEGIDFMPAEYEIRTFFDSSFSVFGKKQLPLKYKVKISYSGGTIDKLRNTVQTLDLNNFEGLGYIDKKGIHEFVKAFEGFKRDNNKNVNSIAKISELLSNGLWIKNLNFEYHGKYTSQDEIKSALYSKLQEFKILWESIYSDDSIEDYIIRKDLQLKFLELSSEMISLISLLAEKENKLKDCLIDVSKNLLELGKAKFYADGGDSVKKFNELGNSTIKQMKTINPLTV